MRADEFEPARPEVQERWRLFGRPGFAGSDQTFYPEYLGLTIEEVRVGYCRMRMTFRPELLQAGGVVHGGAIASLLDSTLVPAIGGVVEAGSRFSTVDLHVSYLEALMREDCVAEGWIVRRGRRLVFGQAEARAADTGRLVATAVLTYHVSPPPASI